MTNLTIQQQWTAFKEPDLRDPVQARDVSVLSTMINAGRSGIETRLDVAVQIDSDSRLLAKLGLAVGYKMFGARFLAAEYASTLRAALWEPSLEKRCGLAVRGTGYLRGALPFGSIGAILKWPGAWVLTIMRSGGLLSLAVTAPSGRSMNVLVCEEPDLVNGLDRLRVMARCG